MNLSIQHLTVLEVHKQPELLHSLASLTVPTGTMQRHLVDPSGDLSTKHVWIAKRDNQEIVGWVLRFPSQDVDHLCYYHFYVKPEFRRQGIATVLTRAANLSAQENTIYRTSAWTEESRGFLLSLRHKQLVDNLEIVQT